MNRRKSFIAIIVLVLGLSLQAVVLADRGRVDLNFNTDWLFAARDVPQGQAPDCPEKEFEAVCLPHTNSLLNTRYTMRKQMNSYRIISWYRRHFALPKTHAGKRVLVNFQGGGQEAMVYVNGKQVANHKGAYGSFTVDITEAITFGNADNVLAVRLDDTRRRDIPPHGDKIDFAMFGGLCRDVSMTLVDPVHVVRAFYPMTEVNAADARVGAQIRLANKGGKSVAGRVVTTVLNKGGKTVVTGAAEYKLAGNTEESVEVTLPTIATPHLWSVDRPYLYNTRTQVFVGDKMVDEHLTRIGLRSATFSKQDGKFRLNGTPLKLRGLNRHGTFAYIGRAAPNRLQRQDADILKFELGCNTVRTSHYMQDPEFLERCDEIGLLVFEEIPGWQHIGNAAWQQIAIQTVEEMVLRDRNHPSIILWGVRCNETSDNDAFYGKTNALARKLDPTRATGGVRNFISTHGKKQEDVFTYNDFDQDDQKFNELIKPLSKPWFVTEYLGHTFPTPRGGSDYRLVEHFLHHARVQNDNYRHDELAGALAWCAFDYNTEFFGDGQRLCYHGVTDIFRIPKHAAYLYRSQMDPKTYGPVLYAANAWNPWKAGGSPNDLYIAGNVEEIEVFLGRQSFGRIKPNTMMHLPHPLFRITHLRSGEGQITVKGLIGGKAVATLRVRAAGRPAKLIVKPDHTNLIADGSDMTRVLVEVVDKSGKRVTQVSDTMAISLTGPGTFIGEQHLPLESGAGAFYVQTKLDQVGSITCTVNGLDMETTAEIKVTPMVAKRVPVPQN